MQHGWVGAHGRGTYVRAAGLLLIRLGAGHHPAPASSQALAVSGMRLFWSSLLDLASVVDLALSLSLSLSLPPPLSLPPSPPPLSLSSLSLSLSLSYLSLSLSLSLSLVAFGSFGMAAAPSDTADARVESANGRVMPPEPCTAALHRGFLQGLLAGCFAAWWRGKNFPLCCWPSGTCWETRWGGFLCTVCDCMYDCDCHALVRPFARRTASRAQTVGYVFGLLVHLLVVPAYVVLVLTVHGLFNGFVFAMFLGLLIPTLLLLFIIILPLKWLMKHLCPGCYVACECDKEPSGDGDDRFDADDCVGDD